MLNALANHDVLPHDGKGITKEMAVTAITQALNVDAGLAGVLAMGGVMANPERGARTFDLDHLKLHGWIEHDGSLTRDDAAFGSDQDFCPRVWEGVLKSYGDCEETTMALASKARYTRVMESKAAHQAANKTFRYGIKEFVTSYGETALLLAVLGDPVDGRVPLRYMRVLFGRSSRPMRVTC